jgi:hypothetical protein
MRAYSGGSSSHGRCVTRVLLDRDRPVVARHRLVELTQIIQSNPQGGIRSSVCGRNSYGAAIAGESVGGASERAQEIPTAIKEGTLL